MTDEKILHGGGRTPNLRYYRWDYDQTTGEVFFRGPGISRDHQPGPRHPVWRLVEFWKRGLGLK